MVVRCGRGDGPRASQRARRARTNFHQSPRSARSSCRTRGCQSKQSWRSRRRGRTADARQKSRWGRGRGGRRCPTRATWRGRAGRARTACVITARSSSDDRVIIISHHDAFITLWWVDHLPPSHRVSSRPPCQSTLVFARFLKLAPPDQKGSGLPNCPGWIVRR